MSDATFGPFTFDRTTGALTRDGKAVAIGTRGAALLKALLDAQGAAVGKDALLEAAWPGTIVEESNLSVQIAMLRKTLGERDDGAEWITTVPRIGYRLSRGSGRLHAEAPAPRIGPSIAVLPFANLSGDPGQDYFADGIVDDIITALSRFRSLAVVARNSSFTYKGRAVDVREVARDLGVGYVLEGSVRKAGAQLRVNAQLVSGVSGEHLWAHNFDGPLEDIFDVQDRITAGVAALVAPSIEKAEIERARRERPGSLAVHDLYLRALARFESLSPSDNAAGLELLDRAIALDPEYAPALALAAHSREHRMTMGWPAYRDDDREVALDLAQRALDRAGDDGATIARCGMVMLFVGRDFDRGVSLLERSAAINPNHEVVVMNAGVAHMVGGSLDKATEYFLRAIDMTLNQSIAAGGIAMVNLYRGRHEEALEWATRSLAINPNLNVTYWVLIAANAILGRQAEAARWLESLQAMSPGVTVSSISRGQCSKDPRRAQTLIEGLRLAGMPEG